MNVVSSAMSKFDNLRIAEARLKSVSMYNPNSNEVLRFAFIVSDLKSTMSQDELMEYNYKKNYVPSASEIETLRLETMEVMNANVDKPSI